MTEPLTGDHDRRGGRRPAAQLRDFVAHPHAHATRNPAANRARSLVPGSPHGDTVTRAHLPTDRPRALAATPWPGPEVEWLRVRPAGQLVDVCFDVRDLMFPASTRTTSLLPGGNQPAMTRRCHNTVARTPCSASTKPIPPWTSRPYGDAATNAAAPRTAPAAATRARTRLTEPTVREQACPHTPGHPARLHRARSRSTPAARTTATTRSTNDDSRSAAPP